MTKPNPLRFKRRIYGRGRTPSVRQGRLTTGIYMLIIIAGASITPSVGQIASTQETLLLSIWFIVPTLFLIWICYRTGPKPKRQRGPPQS